MKELREFLEDAELVHYYDGLRTQLRLTAVAQLKCVDDDQLTQLGMTKPEVRRLRQFFKKECPQSALSKLRKVSRCPRELAAVVSDWSVQWSFTDVCVWCGVLWCQWNLVYMLEEWNILYNICRLREVHFCRITHVCAELSCWFTAM